MNAQVPTGDRFILVFGFGMRDLKHAVRRASSGKNAPNGKRGAEFCRLRRLGARLLPNRQNICWRKARSGPKAFKSPSRALVWLEQFDPFNYSLIAALSSR